MVNKDVSTENSSDVSPVPHHKTTVRVMVIIIAMLIICIVTRWEYVKKEVTDAVNSRFKTEQKK